MTENELLKAVGGIDDDLVEEAMPESVRKTMRKKPIVLSSAGLRILVPVAASVALGLFFGIRYYQQRDIDVDEVLSGAPQTVTSMDEAQDIAGFPFGYPDEILGMTPSSISVIGESIVEVIYGEAPESAVTVRKSRGTEDNSGDYNIYSEEEAVISGGDVILKSRDGKVYTAVWELGGCTYSVHAGGGMDRADAEALIEEIMDLNR